MKANQISTRQLGIMAFMLMFSTKLLYLPSLFYYEVKENALLALMLALTFDLLLLFVAYKFIKNNPGLSFYDFLANKIGRIFSKFVYFFILIFLLCKLILIINGSFVYVRDSFFTQMTLYVFLAVVFFVSNYMARSPVRAMARTCEFFYPIILLGLIAIIFIGFSSNMFQVPNTNWYDSMQKVFLANFKYIAYFGDPIILLLIADKIKFDCKFSYNFFKFPIIASIIMFLVFFIYYGMFTYVSPAHITAIADITQFTDYSADIGRLDIVASITYLFLILLQCGIYIRYCLNSVCCIIQTKHKNILQLSLNILIIVLIYFIFVNNETTIKFVSTFMPYLVIGVIYLLPLIACFFKTKKQSRREHEKIH